MITSLVLVAFVCLQTEGPTSTPTSSQAKPSALNFRDVLTANEELRTHHRGYRHYLLANPKIAAAELAWLDVTQVSSIRTVATAFDEALNDDPAAQRLFDQFYDQLARDLPLRNAVETLQRTEFGQGRLGPLFSDAMTYFRANPDDALRFLQNPQLLEVLPQTLAPMLKKIGGRPEVLDELQGALEDVTDLPMAHTRVFPWWTTLGPFDEKHKGAYSNLAAHFAKYPHRFWPWHQRNVALAGDAQARDWIRYWHRKVRRTAGFGDDYMTFVHGRLDEEAKYPVSGETPKALADWPPKAAPPVLPPLGNNVGQSSEGTKKRADAPSRRIQPPPRPTKPLRPEPPPRPPRPPRPERPVRPIAERTQNGTGPR